MKKRMKLLAVLLACLMLAGALTFFAFAGGDAIRDVKEEDWGYSDVGYAVEKGYLVGGGDGFFDPDGPATRAMVVTALWRREGSPETKFAPLFTDVSESDYFASPVVWAKRYGIANGTTETEFAPNANVTREQLASMLMRYTASLGYSTSFRADLAAYSDAGSITEYAEDAVSWAVRTGLFKGTESDTLSPGDTATREEFAAVLRRYDDVTFTFSNIKAKFNLIYPAEGEEISVLTPVMKTFTEKFYSGEFDDPGDPNAILDWLPSEDDINFAGGKHDLTYPASIDFKWTCDDPRLIMKLEFSERADFTNRSNVTIGEIFSLSDGVYSCKVTNLKIGTTYYWRVRASSFAKSAIGSFTTAREAFRPIFLEGGSNVRDLGGRLNAEGKTIRQGAIFRGAEVESYAFEYPHLFLTYEGRRALAEDLGVKTRLDLQVDSLEGDHHQGEWFGVDYYVKPGKQWEMCFGINGDEWMKEVFEIALDTTKYPLLFHCYSGADRTGTLAAMLECLLGMNMKDVRFDYDLTSLCICEKRSWYRKEYGVRDRFFKTLSERFPDAETPQEQVEAYVLSLGIAPETIEAFRDYMILDGDGTASDGVKSFPAYEKTDVDYSELNADIDLVYPADGEEISVLNPLMKLFQRRYYKGDFDDLEDPLDVFNWLPEEDDVYYRSGAHDHTYPTVVNFRWTCDDPRILMTLEFSEDEDFSAPANVTVDDVLCTSDGVYCCFAMNFKPDTQYYWRVKTDAHAEGEVRSFTTAPARYRPIYLEGGSNVRDLGGWVNMDGKQIRTGVIFRGAEPESYEFEDPHHYLTYEGRRALAEDLGVRTRLDLQEESLEGDHFLGEWFGIEYFVKPCKQWDACLDGEGIDWTREIFEVALDTSKYPMYFHCYAGADRTGTVGAILECLLGMDMKDIRFDFEITSLTITAGRSWYKDRDGSRVRFFELLAERFPDVETPQERVEEFLISIGISREKIEAFRDYMILD